MADRAEGTAEVNNPLGTVIALMDSLTAKITAEGEAEEEGQDQGDYQRDVQAHRKAEWGFKWRPGRDAEGSEGTQIRMEPHDVLAYHADYQNSRT